MTFSYHCVARSSDSKKYDFLSLTFSYLIFLKVYLLVFWLIMLLVIWASYSTLKLMFLNVNYTWILHIFHTRYLLETGFFFIFEYIYAYCHISLGLLSLGNLADANLSQPDLYCSYGHPPLTQLIQACLSLNNCSTSHSLFTCCLKASKSCSLKQAHSLSLLQQISPISQLIILASESVYFKDIPQLPQSSC